MRAQRAALALRCGALLLAAALASCHSAPAADPSAAVARRLIAEAQLFLPGAGPEFGQRPILLARLALAAIARAGAKPPFLPDLIDASRGGTVRRRPTG